MKPIERLRAAVNFEDYDRPPFADNEWNEVLGDMVPLLSGCAPRADGRYSDAERARAVQASMDMVPWSTFMSCGNSSRELLRRKPPKGVTRESPLRACVTVP